MALAFVFLFGAIFNFEIVSNYSRALILPFFVCLYFIESERKSFYFATFLISCSLAELSKIFWDFNYSLFSTVSNIGYIIGYSSLLFYMAKSINYSILFKKFQVPIIVLTVFNIYLIYTLNQMILADETIKTYTFSFVLECFYNICVLLILSVSLLNYLYHDSKRSLLLFLASVCIVFSEMVQVAYIFVSSAYVLSIVYSILLFTGFLLVYIYITSKINKYYKVLF